MVTEIPFMVLSNDLCHVARIDFSDFSILWWYLLANRYIRPCCIGLRWSFSIIPSVFTPPRPWYATYPSTCVYGFVSSSFHSDISDRLYGYPIYVWFLIIKVWWANIVGLGPMGAGTWTIHKYSGLRTDNGFVAIVVLSWYDIQCPIYVIKSASRMVLFMTLEQVSDNKKSIKVQFMACVTTTRIFILLRTYLDDILSW